jgi:hypothetical protein
MHPLPVGRGALILASVLAVASLLFLATAPAPPIITSGPDKESTRSSATFQFTGGTGRLDAYVCDLGSRAIRKVCTSPVTFTDLEPGTYTFTVRERTTTGASDNYTWTITAIDDDGDGHFVPADCDDAAPGVFPGASDVPGNGIDEDCSGSDAPIVIYQPAPPLPQSPIPPAAPTPTLTPAPTPTPTPAKPKVGFSLQYFMTAGRRSTRFSTLNVKGVPKGATVKVTCTGGCPRKRQTIKKSGTVALTGYRKRAIRAGAKLTISVTKAGSIGMAKVVTIRADRRPRITTKTLR